MKLVDINITKLSPSYRILYDDFTLDIPSEKEQIIKMISGFSKKKNINFFKTMIERNEIKYNIR